LLTAAFGGAAALVANAAGRPLAVRADDESIQVGHEYDTATKTTAIRKTVVNDNTVLEIDAGTSRGNAIWGLASNGYGVSGSSVHGIGVVGHADHGVGVRGDSEFGTAVDGSSNFGTGISGSSEGGRGVSGVAGEGVGVHASSEHESGVALEVAGRASFKYSGVAILPAGRTSLTIDTLALIDETSFVLLTPMHDLAGGSLWSTTHPRHRFTIHLSAPRPSRTKVAWILLGGHHPG
jgi:hypothetical protein